MDALKYPPPEDDSASIVPYVGPTEEYRAVVRAWSELETLSSLRMSANAWPKVREAVAALVSALDYMEADGDAGDPLPYEGTSDE
jgi:hypothetical protein